MNVRQLQEANSQLIELCQVHYAKLIEAHKQISRMCTTGSDLYTEQVHCDDRIVVLQHALEKAVNDLEADSSFMTPVSSPQKDVPIEVKYEKLKAKYHRHEERHLLEIESLRKELDIAKKHESVNSVDLFKAVPFVDSCLRVMPIGLVDTNAIWKDDTLFSGIDDIVGPNVSSANFVNSLVAGALPLVKMGSHVVVILSAMGGCGRSTAFVDILKSFSNMEDTQRASKLHYDCVLCDEETTYPIVSAATLDVFPFENILSERQKFSNRSDTVVTIQRRDWIGKVTVVDLPMEFLDVSSFHTLIAASKKCRDRATTSSFEYTVPLHGVLFPILSQRTTFLKMVGIVSYDSQSSNYKDTASLVGKVRQMGNRRKQPI